MQVQGPPATSNERLTIKRHDSRTLPVQLRGGPQAMARPAEEPLDKVLGLTGNEGRCGTLETARVHTIKEPVLQGGEVVLTILRRTGFTALTRTSSFTFTYNSRRKDGRSISSTEETEGLFW